MNRQSVLYRMCGVKDLSQVWNGRSDMKHVPSTYCCATNYRDVNEDSGEMVNMVGRSMRSPGIFISSSNERQEDGTRVSNLVPTTVDKVTAGKKEVVSGWKFSKTEVVEGYSPERGAWIQRRQNRRPRRIVWRSPSPPNRRSMKNRLSAGGLPTVRRGLLTVGAVGTEDDVGDSYLKRRKYKNRKKLVRLYSPTLILAEEVQNIFQWL